MDEDPNGYKYRYVVIIEGSHFCCVRLVLDWFVSVLFILNMYESM
jgi:hypothetical protein